MTAIYGRRTDGCGTVGCLAGLTVLDCTEEVAATRRRTAPEPNLQESGVSLLDAAGHILGLDEATRGALFCGLGSAWFEVPTPDTSSRLAPATSPPGRPPPRDRGHEPSF